MKRYFKLLTLLLFYTTVIYHLVDYDNFPFSPNYQFPFSAIIKAYLPSILVAISLEWYYQYIFKKNSLEPKAGVIQFLKITILSSVSLFTIAYFIIVREIGNLYYIIISFILTMANLILWITIIYGKTLFLKWIKLGGQNSLNIKSGTTIHKVNLSEVSHFSSRNKIVIAHLKSGKDIITNFNLRELEGILPKEFFRINRQFILNKEVIDLVKQAKNQTLDVQLKSRKLETSLIVSRYRASSFRKWLA